MVFKVVETQRDLRTPPKKSEAYLSDLFFVLYLIYLSKTISKINIQKCIVYVLEKLLEKNKLDDIKVFNLSFYRWGYGDYNKCISTDYIPELLRGGLIEEVDGDKNGYTLTAEAGKLFKRYEKENASNEKLLLVQEIIGTYPEDRKGFLFPFGYSHKRKVEYKGKELSIDDLEPDESKATAYNTNPNEIEGFKSNIVSTNYLLALSSLLDGEQSKQEESEEQEERVKKILQEAGIEL